MNLKKPDIKDCILYIFIYMDHLEYRNTYRYKMDDCQSLEMNVRFGAGEMKISKIR
jgi:hypothetical protein